MKEGRRTRIIALTLILATFYGLVSGIANQNRAQDIPPRKINDKAVEWSPSLVWLPSFILCHTRGHSGMNYAKIGYFFDSEADRLRYVILSAVLGLFLGLTALFSTTVRKWLRDAEDHGDKSSSIRDQGVE
jgi:hypothetical protein